MTFAEPDPAPPNIGEPIVEALYAEALVLADEARQVFDLTTDTASSVHADRLRLALSVEGLRTTTRVMHVLAWLLNHRAFFAGELSALQLRRYSQLPADRPSEADNLDLLLAPTVELIMQSERLHARVARLDLAWRDTLTEETPPVRQLHQRLDQTFATAR